MRLRDDDWTERQARPTIAIPVVGSCERLVEVEFGHAAQLLVFRPEWVDALQRVDGFFPDAAAKVTRDGNLLQRLLPVDERIGEGSTAIGTHGTCELIAPRHERLTLLGPVDLAMMVVVAIEVACLRAAVHVVLATGREAVVAALSFQDGPAVRGEEVFFPKFHRDALVGNRLLVHRHVLRLPLLIPVLRIHLVEHGTRDNRRCKCNNPHQ